MTLKKTTLIAAALLIPFGGTLVAGVSDSIGAAVDTGATKTKAGTDTGETKANNVIVEKAGDNAITQTATGKVKSGNTKAKKGTDAGAAKVKKTIGAAGAAEQKAVTGANEAAATVNKAATDAQNATAPK